MCWYSTLLFGTADSDFCTLVFPDAHWDSFPESQRCRKGMMRSACMSPCLLAKLKMEMGEQSTVRKESLEVVWDCRQKNGYGVIQPKNLKV